MASPWLISVARERKGLALCLARPPCSDLATSLGVRVATCESFQCRPQRGPHTIGNRSAHWAEFIIATPANLVMTVTAHMRIGVHLPS